MTTATPTVPTKKYLDFADHLTTLALDCMEDGLTATGADFGLAAGAIITLLVDAGMLDNDFKTILK